MITEEDYEKILRNFETGLSVSGLMAIERREGCETFGQLWSVIASQYHSKDYLNDDSGLY